MLQHIRDRLQGIFAWAIVIMITFAFGFWGIHSYMGTGAKSQVLAKVDGKKITSESVNKSYRQWQRQQMMRLGDNFSITPAQQIKVKEQILDHMIKTQALATAATKSGFQISQREILATIQNMPLFSVDGQFSTQRFQGVLSAMMMTETQFADKLKQAMLVGQVESGYLTSSFILPQELNQGIALIQQTRDIGYFVIPWQGFMGKTKVSPQQIQTYYDQHKSEFVTPEKVSLQYLELSESDLEKGLTFSQQELKSFYNANLNLFTTPQSWKVAHILIRIPTTGSHPDQDAKNKAESIKKQLDSGKPFGQLAKEYSDDTASSAKNGDIGWMKLGQLDGAFDSALKQLTKPGQIVGPVKTKYGYEIIKLIQIKPEKIIPFQTAIPQVKKQLAKQKAESLFASKGDQ